MYLNTILSLGLLSLIFTFTSSAPSSNSKGPVIVPNEFQCGGAITAYDQGGIFYKYNEEETSDEALCIWTVTPAPNSTFNSLRFDLVSEEFDSDAEDQFISFVYPTVDGQLVEVTRLEHGSAGSIVEIPAQIAFVIYNAQFYTDGKGFILHYEGIQLPDSTVQHLENGDRLNFVGTNGTNTIYTPRSTPTFSTYVYQHSALNPGGYGGVNLTISEFNIGVGPTSILDKVDIWILNRESGYGKSEALTIQPFVTISGSSSRYDGGQGVVVAGRWRNSLIAILRGGRADYTRLNISWNSD